MPAQKPAKGDGRGAPSQNGTNHQGGGGQIIQIPVDPQLQLVATLQKENQALRERVAALEQAPAYRTREQMDQDLKRLGMELQQAQAYSARPDIHPGSTILKMLGVVNSSISNIASNIAELYEDKRIPRCTVEEFRADKATFGEHKALAKAAVGKRLYEVIAQIEMLPSKEPQPDDELPMQIALRSLLVRWAADILSVFKRIPGDRGVALRDAYEVIRQQEGQSVAARWRVLAIVATIPQERSNAEDVIRDIEAVLSVSGISRRGPAFEKAIIDVRRRIGALEVRLLELKQAIQEGITSSDMEVFEIQPTATSDPQTMDTLYNDVGGTKTTKPIVLCSCSLGLRTVVSSKIAGQEVCEQKVEIMKKPEVVLDMVLDDYDVFHGDALEQEDGAKENEHEEPSSDGSGAPGEDGRDGNISGIIVKHIFKQDPNYMDPAVLNPTPKLIE